MPTLIYVFVSIAAVCASSLIASSLTVTGWPVCPGFGRAGVRAPLYRPSTVSSAYQERPHATFVPGLILSAIEDVKRRRQCKTLTQLRTSRPLVFISVRLWVVDLIRDHPEVERDELVDLGEELLAAFDAILIRFRHADVYDVQRRTRPGFKQVMAFVVYLLFPRSFDRICSFTDSVLQPIRSAAQKASLEFGELIARNDFRGVFASTALDRLERCQHRLKGGCQLGQHVLGRVILRRRGETVDQVLDEFAKRAQAETTIDAVINIAMRRAAKFERIVSDQVSDVLLSGRRSSTEQRLGAILGSSIPEVAVLRLIFIAVLKGYALL